MTGRQAAGLTASVSLHLFALASQLVPAWGTSATPSSSGPPPVEIVFAPPEDVQYPGLNPLPDQPDVPEFEREYPSVTVRNATFDVTRIARRADVLFPFLSPGLSLELFALRPQEAFDRFLHNPLVWSGSTDSLPPKPTLTMDDSEIQALIDRSWERRDRWKAGQPVFDAVDASDLSSGRGPKLLREYVEQNLGQYYEDPRTGERDARLWTELALAADHVDFIAYVRRNVSAAPGSRGATELLFMLDKVAESNRNILATLQSIDPTRDLTATRAKSRDAFTLIDTIKRHYAVLLRTRGLKDDRDVGAAYDGVRLAILGGVLKTTPAGFRANDARALIGGIHWRAGNSVAALDAWCALEPLSPDDEYQELIEALIVTLRVPAGTDVCTTRELGIGESVAVERVLRRERGRLWEFQYRRLLQFGYSLDSF